MTPWEGLSSISQHIGFSVSTLSSFLLTSGKVTLPMTSVSHYIPTASIVNLVSSQQNSAGWKNTPTLLNKKSSSHTPHTVCLGRHDRPGLGEFRTPYRLGTYHLPFRFNMAYLLYIGSAHVSSIHPISASYITENCNFTAQ